VTLLFNIICLLIKRIAIGKPKEDIILFLHGAWHGAWCWEKYFMDIFAEQGYENYALTLRLHNNGGKIKGINTISILDYVEDLTNAVDDIINQAGKEPIIIAHSMGGLVLQKYLEKRSCKKAVLMATLPVSGVLRTTTNFLIKKSYSLPSILTFNLYGLVNSIPKLKWAFFSDDAKEEDLKLCEENLCSESYRAFLDMQFPRVKINYHTKIPMLVIGAALDNIFTVNEQKKTAEKFNADLIIVPDIAHNMMLDTRHQQTSKEILEWLKKS